MKRMMLLDAGSLKKSYLLVMKFWFFIHAEQEEMVRSFERSQVQQSLFWRVLQFSPWKDKYKNNLA